MWAVAAFPLQGGKNSLLVATVEPYSVGFSGMLTSTYSTVGAFSYSGSSSPFTHSARCWGGSACQEGREVNVCAGASLCFGYWVVLGYLEPLDPDLCSHQGGRPLMESAAHCLWDFHLLAPF